jgi:hypothetical protein
MKKADYMVRYQNTLPDYADGTALRTNRAARLNPLIHSLFFRPFGPPHELWQSECVKLPVWLLLRTLRFGAVLLTGPRQFPAIARFLLRAAFALRATRRKPLV